MSFQLQENTKTVQELNFKTKILIFLVFSRIFIKNLTINLVNIPFFSLIQLNKDLLAYNLEQYVAKF